MLQRSLHAENWKQLTGRSLMRYLDEENMETFAQIIGIFYFQ